MRCGCLAKWFEDGIGSGCDGSVALKSLEAMNGVRDAVDGVSTLDRPLACRFLTLTASYYSPSYF